MRSIPSRRPRVRYSSIWRRSTTFGSPGPSAGSPGSSVAGRRAGGGRWAGADGNRAGCAIVAGPGATIGPVGSPPTARRISSIICGSRSDRPPLAAERTAGKRSDARPHRGHAAAGSTNSVEHAGQLATVRGSYRDGRAPAAVKGPTEGPEIRGEYR